MSCFWKVFSLLLVVFVFFSEEMRLLKLRWLYFCVIDRVGVKNKKVVKRMYDFILFCFFDLGIVFMEIFVKVVGYWDYNN